MRRSLSLLAVAASALTIGVAQAAADEPGAPPAQTAGEPAQSGQAADGSSGAYQGAPAQTAGESAQSGQAADGSSGGYQSAPDQTAGESAESGQIADGGSSAYQDAPSNRAISVRVLSPGDDGAVTQSNDVNAASLAANKNGTSQTADQSQGGGYGSDSTQVAGQEAQNHQYADADAAAVQKSPSNQAINVRVLSPGSNGDVTQSNSASAGALAANGNKTDQTTDQTQAGGGYGSDSTQIAGQDASNKQGADADATAVQLHPTNESTNVRVLSKGDNGNVSQSNSNTAAAAALNGNKTDQSTDQEQGKGGYGSDSTQIAGQDASNKQGADADATAVQLHPSNKSTSVRVLSKGDDGDVSQSNSNTAVAAALNGNKTHQDIDQTQGGKGSHDLGSRDGCKCSSGSDSTQIAGQESKNAQWADADAVALQKGASNENTPVRVGSKGDDGDVSQSNSNTAVAAALNGNKTHQDIDQTQGGKGSHDLGSRDGCKCSSGSDSTQIAGQESKNAQWADADAVALQKGASNENTPVRVGSKGDDGDVSQSNSNTAVAAALNGNKTHQDIDQTQGGKGSHDLGSRDGCKCSSGSDSTQIAGQESKNAQWADADAVALQKGASNENTPVRVGSKGDDGDVSQSNSNTAVAAALNGNKTHQDIDQTQGGKGSHDLGSRDGCKCSSGSDYLQVAGQESKNAQWADADAVALQKGASNENTPVRVGSKGDDGDVSQSNSNTAVAAALNGNKTHQDIDQTQGGKGSHDLGSRDGCKCSSGSDYLQVAGQESKNAQWADADAVALQKGASNENTPVRVGSKGDDGDVWQSNSNTAIAAGINANKTHQDIEQTQAGKGGHGSLDLQAAGQRNSSRQGATAGALAAQLGASNENDPVRVASKGGHGSVYQSNSVGVLAAALNLNGAWQSIGQSQPATGHEQLQVSGQDDWSSQYGDARAYGVQDARKPKGGKSKR